MFGDVDRADLGSVLALETYEIGTRVMHGAIQGPSLCLGFVHRCEQLATFCDPTNNLGQAGVMVDRVLASLRP